MTASSRQGRKRTAQKLAVGSARPDLEAQRVTVETCRRLLNRPALSDEEAQSILDHLYRLAHVTVDAFIERLDRPNKSETITDDPAAMLPTQIAETPLVV